MEVEKLIDIVVDRVLRENRTMLCLIMDGPHRRDLFMSGIHYILGLKGMSPVKKLKNSLVYPPTNKYNSFGRIHILSINGNGVNSIYATKGRSIDFLYVDFGVKHYKDIVDALLPIVCSTKGEFMNKNAHWNFS